MNAVIVELRALRGEVINQGRMHPDRSITWGVVKGLFLYQFIGAAFVFTILFLSTVFCSGAMNQALKNMGAPTGRR
jgi:hypothetical protein